VQAKKAVKLDKRDYRGWFFLATAYEDSGNRVKAIPARLSALELDPFNTSNMLELVKDYKAANDFDKAKAVGERIKPINPSGDDYKQALVALQA
jgi:tetratricopeptide (TPR) repeat protein